MGPNSGAISSWLHACIHPGTSRDSEQQGSPEGGYSDTWGLSCTFELSPRARRGQSEGRMGIGQAPTVPHAGMFGDS